MGKTKFDLIAASKKKSYKIIMGSILAFGAVLMIFGFILLATVTPTVMPKSLDVEMSGLNGEGPYTKTITQDTWITINTGTDDSALEVPIVFTLDENAKLFIEDIMPMYRAGMTKLILKDTFETGDTGTLTITCGSMPRIVITLTAKAE